MDPTYKPTWDLPGGAVEEEESPHAACRREVAEELGLDRAPGRVLVVDWVPSRPERPEGLIVVYDGGVLAPGEVAAIKLRDGELAGISSSSWVRFLPAEFSAPSTIWAANARRPARRAADQ